jgi:hypothetical protein
MAVIGVAMSLSNVPSAGLVERISDLYWLGMLLWVRMASNWSRLTGWLEVPGGRRFSTCCCTMVLMPRWLMAQFPTRPPYWIAAKKAIPYVTQRNTPMINPRCMPQRAPRTIRAVRMISTVFMKHLRLRMAPARVVSGSLPL